MATNTGNEAWLKLKKVVRGGSLAGQPLDENNRLCSVTGLPQDKKDNNVGDPDYIPPRENLTHCPLDLIGNDRISREIAKNDCPSGTNPIDTVSIVVDSDSFFDLNKDLANALAEAWIDENGQAEANARGTCVTT